MSSIIKYQEFQLIVAIDPDVERNGIACLDIPSKRLTIKSLSFPETIEYLFGYKATKNSGKYGAIVLIEAGWLNHTHWHTKTGDSIRVIAAKGNSVGRNHEVGRKIAEMCEYWNIPYKLVKPLSLRSGGRNIWKGKDGKITAGELQSLTGYKGRTNQEGRDAALLAWIWAKRVVNGF